MLKIGITGGIGSGKTTVAAIFELLGVPVYYCDSRAKQLMQRSDIQQCVMELFGTLSREKIARVVFADSAKLNALNDIIHPAVNQDFREWSECQNSRYVLQETAILIESGAHLHVDKIIVVDAPLPLRIERVMRRDGVAREAALQRIAAQISSEERLKYAHFTIIADDHHLLLPQVIKINEQLWNA